MCDAARLDLHDAVRRWQVAVGLPVNDAPTLDVPDGTKELRCALIEEEAAELRAALEANDIVEVADALADLLYVVHGAALTFGIPIYEVFAEVHHSNMTKVATDGRVRRRADGKVLKPPAFRPPELEPILASHARRETAVVTDPG